MRNHVFPNYTKIVHSTPLVYKNSRPDQEIYQLAFGKYGLHVDEIWEQDCISIVSQDNSTVSLPVNCPWFKGTIGKPQSNSIPFLHMFDGMESPQYNRIYQSILKGQHE